MEISKIIFVVYPYNSINVLIILRPCVILVIKVSYGVDYLLRSTCINENARVRYRYFEIIYGRILDDGA